MKKTEVKQFEIVKDEWGNPVYPTDVALSYIANILSNFEHGLSRLAVDNNVEEVYLGNVENSLEQINIGISNISVSIDELNTTQIDTNNNLELIVMQLSRIAEALENKTKNK